MLIKIKDYNKNPQIYTKYRRLNNNISQILYTFTGNLMMKDEI